MKLPSRFALALGMLVTGLLTLSTELEMSHPLHVLAALVCGVVLFLLHPEEAGVLPPKGKPGA